MTVQPLKIVGLKSFSNAAVWNEHSDPKCELAFVEKTLIYGFNGSGKTTLSRVFSSIERTNIESSLPKTATFEVVLSDGQSVKSTNLSNPFEKNLLVFNQDFTQRNFKWDESSVEPIFFLSEEDIDKKKKHEEAATKHLDTTKALEGAKTAIVAAENALKEFKKVTARRVRDIVPQMTQSFDARRIETEYGDRNFTKDDQLSEEQIVRLQGVLSDEEPLAKKPALSDPSEYAAEHLPKILYSLSQSPGSVIADELSHHSSMLQWIKSGLDYHVEQQIEDCLLCGNKLTDDRKSYLSKSFDSTWDDFVSGLSSVSSTCGDLTNKLQALRDAIPSSNDIQLSERPIFSAAQKNLLSVISAWHSYMKDLDNALGHKVGNPSKIIAAPSFTGAKVINERIDELRDAVSVVNESIHRHNSLHDEFAQRQQEAFDGLRNHVLSEEKDGWKQVIDGEVKAKEYSTAAEHAKAAAEKAFKELDAEIRTHGKGADQLNSLLNSYLGHGGIQLESVDAGYKLIRADGQPAERLSEGERTALAFCHFLTQLKAEGRSVKQLVLVIDDPISSLDTSARTHAFSLMRRMSTPE